ncbi:GEVED domain-containing protein [Zunongwangia sp.]|uniref:GEVED domain-containing protein n=1 Tax=Zunongwangia sp. TaxID=1965325 RepID=UPI003AA9530E
MYRNNYLIFTFLLVISFTSFAQKDILKPTFLDSAQAIQSAPLSISNLTIPETDFKLYNPRNRGINKIVPGKGLPKYKDPAIQLQKGMLPSKAPSVSFDAVRSRSTPTDPTGVAGRNHYLNAWNSAFSIYDKQGNLLLGPTSLASIGGEFEGETLGDPIVVYDQFADRYLISEFSDSPEGILIAISKGPDPVNDGWYTYRFSTNGSFPDYPKISVWSDGYYLTSNKDQFSPEQSQVIYVYERDKMLEGETAQVVSFPLPGIQTNGFYSPAGFNAMGDLMPPPGNVPIIYLQDDAWSGVFQDHLKIWLVNVDWQETLNSTIEESQELGAAEGVSPFRATFDGGNFSNLAQPGDNNNDIDALQATMMYMTQYRRFSDHNSAVLNFVVDVEASSAKHAGIRWYELRQNTDGEPWYVYQEGTYAPDKSDRFSGSIGIDDFGNIGLGFTIVDDSPETPVFPSIRYTGRYANDELGIMTLEEQEIVTGESPDPSERYGDYAHLTVDPTDGISFWHNAEYFDGIYRKNRVAKFQIASDLSKDIGVTEIIKPIDATLGDIESITVKVRNFSAMPLSEFELGYRVDGGTINFEDFNTTIAVNDTEEVTFNNKVDLSEIGKNYELEVFSNIAEDQNRKNDTLKKVVRNLPPKDVGITSIDAPTSSQNFDTNEQVTVTLENFGGRIQSQIPIWYQIGNNNKVQEVFNGNLAVGRDTIYTFQQQVDLSYEGRYEIRSGTALPEDFDAENDTTQTSIASLNCIPVGSDCSLKDGLSYFEFADILNENIPCGKGYNDYINYIAYLDRAQSSYMVVVKTTFNAQEDEEQFSLWIDFNDNGEFDDNERLITSEPLLNPNQAYSFDITLPENAPLGQHLMRVRAGDVTYDGDLNNPCEVMEYGTTHDYSVNIVDSNLNIEDFILNEAELKVLNGKDGIHKVVLETTFDKPLRITVHNVLGQLMLENKISNTNGTGYVYDLDMSYAAKGVYLVRVGTRKVGKVKRFIVK